MSTPQPAPEHQENWKKGKSDYQVANALMKRMGSTKGYDPMPPAQHRWQREADNPELHRLWSWMCAHTIHWGHRSEYAVDVHDHELHMEHAAKDLEMGLPNTYRAWREGVARGLWRNGTREEGRRRLYLCGEVRPVKGEENENIVCADNDPSDFPPYIMRQISKLEPERQKAFWGYHKLDVALDNQLRADLDAARRLIIAQRQDTRFREFGIKKIREEHAPKTGHAAAHAKRQERVQLLLPVLEPVAERYSADPQLSAQTENNSAHTSENGVRKQATEARADTRTLLGRDPSEKSSESQARGHSGTTQSRRAALDHDGEKPAKYLPALKQLPELKGEDQDAENLLWNELRNWQEQYPHSDFSSELLDRACPRDQFFIRGLLFDVGTNYVHQFLLHLRAKFLGLNKNNLAKLPPRAPGYPNGPRSLGLIKTWAKEYRAKLDEAARERVDPRRQKDEIRACLNIIADAHETPDAKLYARELLDAYKADNHTLTE